MYSATLREHALNPQNHREMEKPDATGEASYKRCRDQIKFYFRLEDGVIRDITFTGRACAPAIAAASLTTTLLQGLSVDEAREISVFQLNDALGGLPPSKRHALLLVLQCLAEALGPRKNLEKEQ